MKVDFYNEISIINNDDVKWFLFDDMLWISKYKDFLKLEENWEEYVGSYDYHGFGDDTVLFKKNSRRFTNACISYVGKISVRNYSSEYDNLLFGKLGDIEYTCNNEKFSPFEFSDVIYFNEKDMLVSLSQKIKARDCEVIYITNEFGFIVKKDELLGYVLKNSTNHIYFDDEKNKVINSDIIAKYILAVNKINHEDDITGINDLFKYLENKKENEYLLLKNKLYEIIEWY